MRRLRSLLVGLQAVFVAFGLVLLVAPLMIHGGDPRTYPAGILFGGLVLAGLGLAVLWAAGLRFGSARAINFALLALGMLAASAMAITYSLLPGLVGLAYFCCSLGMMETGDMLEDAVRVERATAAASRRDLRAPALSSMARKSAWTVGLAAASCAASAFSLFIVIEAGGVVASTLLSFLSLALLGWLAYNLAAGEDAEASG